MEVRLQEESAAFMFMKYAYNRSNNLQINTIKLTRPIEKAHLPTLILDLDETLVHCSTEPLEKYDAKFTVNFAGIYFLFLFSFSK